MARATPPGRELDEMLRALSHLGHVRDLKRTPPSMSSSVEVAPSSASGQCRVLSSI